MQVVRMEAVHGGSAYGPQEIRQSAWGQRSGYEAACMEAVHRGSAYE